MSSPDGINDIESAIPDFAVESIARCIYPSLIAYFESQEGQAAFEHWKRVQHEKSGPYITSKSRFPYIAMSFR